MIFALLHVAPASAVDAHVVLDHEPLVQRARVVVVVVVDVVFSMREWYGNQDLHRDVEYNGLLSAGAAVIVGLSQFALAIETFILLRAATLGVSRVVRGDEQRLGFDHG